MTYRPFGSFRTALALLVIVQHVGWVGSAGLTWGRWATGSIAVLAFFALSGFVITEAAERFYRGRPLAFSANRAIRIVPQFVLALALSIGAVALAAATHPGFLPNPLLKADAAEMFSAGNLIRNLFKIVPGFPEGIDFVPYAWALRTEVAFYILLAATIFAAARWPRAAWLGLGAVGCLIFTAFLAGKGPGIFHFVPYFAFGVVGYFALTRGSRPLRVICGAMLALCVWTFAAKTLPQQFPAETFTLAETITRSMLLVLLLTLPLGLATLEVSPAAKRWDRKIGDLSFPIYLQQFALLVLAYAFLPRSYLTMAIVFVSAILVGWLSDATLEAALRRIRDRVRGQRVIDAEPVAPASAEASAVGLRSAGSVN